MTRPSASFEQLFRHAPTVAAFAPGRVNLIGEHTDYNGGSVLPCAIDSGIRCAAAVNGTGTLRFYSENFPREGVISIPLRQTARQGCWADYPLAVIRAFAAFGYPIPTGFDCYYSGSLPDGAGLSSSAALEVVTGVVLRELFAIPVTPQELALIGQFAENRFIGVRCGIMDQFTGAMGKRGCAVLLNADTLAYACVPLGSAALVLVNSGVKHRLAASAYNDRRSECETAARLLKTSALCALSEEEFARRSHLIADETIRRRAKHAVSENSRVEKAVQALRKADLPAFGRLMNASHRSLRDDFEVSCAELDFLAETAQRLDGVYGARMTGGGFGGCTVNLMEPAAVALFISAIRSAYHSRFGVVPEIYPVSAGDGAALEEEV